MLSTPHLVRSSSSRKASARKVLRPLAVLSVATALVLGATGCSLIAQQATSIPYSPADGVNIPDSGPLKVRNVLFVADESGTSANMLAAIVNDTDASQTLMIGVDGDTRTVKIPASTVVSLGMDGVEPLLFEDLDTAPGADIEVAFQSGDAEGVLQSVPVLDGTLDYLAEFVPAGR